MADEPNNHVEELDIGPLTLPELHGLARDATLQLRRFWQEILAREARVDGESVLELLDMLDAAIAKET